MLKIQSVSKSFKETVLLENINFTVNKGETVALIGSNGTGKTTLLNIIVGSMLPDSGSIIRDKAVIGLVDQTPKHDFRAVKETFDTNSEEWQIEVALQQVGLPVAIKYQPCSTLSGGQQTRLAFARILVSEPSPNLLLLDEPTNNLDNEGTEWLKIFVKTFNGTVLYASHDRSFINATAKSILKIDNKTIKTYIGNYDNYLVESTKEHNAQIKKYQLHEAEKKKIENLIKKAKDTARHGVRKNKPPDNDKFLWTFKNEHVQKSLAGTAKSLETKLVKLDNIDKPIADRPYYINFDTINPPNKLIMNLEDVTKEYDDRTLFENINFQIRGNERIRIEGPNGSGKTTLLKIASGLLKPEKGSVNCGEEVAVGYYSQAIDGLDHAVNGLDNLMENQLNKTEAYSKAAAMGLSPEHLIMNVSDLSVGQRAKLSIIKLLGQRNNLLILDEPTNHLDIATREAIEKALETFKGCMLIASHDEYFVDKLKIDKTIQLGTA